MSERAKENCEARVSGGIFYFFVAFSYEYAIFEHNGLDFWLFLLVFPLCHVAIVTV